MSKKDFAQEAFNKAADKLSKEEHAAYTKLVAEDSDHILDTVAVKLRIMENKNIETLAAAVVLSGNKDTFIAFTGTLMQLCFHIGWKAGLENAVKMGGGIK